MAAKVVPEPSVMDSPSVWFTLPDRVINPPPNQSPCFSFSVAPTLLMKDVLELVAQRQQAAPRSAFVMPSHALATSRTQTRFPRTAWRDDGVRDSLG